jgi:hypothetical protein
MMPIGVYGQNSEFIGKRDFIGKAASLVYICLYTRKSSCQVAKPAAFTRFLTLANYDRFR